MNVNDFLFADCPGSYCPGVAYLAVDCLDADYPWDHDPSAGYPDFDGYDPVVSYFDDHGFVQKTLADLEGALEEAKVEEATTC